MAAVDVYFADLLSDKESKSLPKKIERIFKLLKPETFIAKDDLVAIKMHFGEPGTNAFIKPYLVRSVVEVIQRLKAKPFLTDTNTLYKGPRQNAVDHLKSAYDHGFLPSVVNAPVIIGDGLNGKDFIRVKIDQKNIKYAHIGSVIYNADAFIALSHPTGHLATGYGGALKNIGMGCGNRAGKQAMHADFKPEVNESKCIGDGACAYWCPTNAIKLVNKKAKVDKNKCIGCGECVSSCETGAISIEWDTPMEKLQEKIVEYAMAVLKNKGNKTGFLNFLTSISPDCDCLPWSDAPIVGDIGILASRDPVALDQATIDLINAQPGNPLSRLTKKGLASNTDKFKALWNIDYSVQLKYAEKVGLGSRRYQLLKI
ncbi:DUF362 domain-containing protein [[Eubacterium] cellulosolvens]